MKSALIIGAGISGLAAAKELARAGVRASILDKGRGVGGRMATRRIATNYGEAKADHGAQYLTSRHSPRFAATLRGLEETGDIAIWEHTPTHKREGAEKVEPRFIAPEGMTAPAKALAQGLDTTLGERAVELHFFIREGKAVWRVVTDKGSVFEADALLLTSPTPQTLDLLNTAPEPLLSAEERRALEAVRYAPCIAVMLALAPTKSAPVFQRSSHVSALQWATGNVAKGVRADVESLTAHLNADFSHKHWETPESDLLPLVWRELRAALAAEEANLLPEDVVATSVHRWKYSRVIEPFGELFFALQSPLIPPCVLAGDAFARSASAEEPARVEDAALSGWAAAEYLLSLR